MKKHEDPAILKQIKRWVLTPGRPSANHLAVSLGYADFNKFWKYLLEISEVPKEKRFRAIQATAQVVEERNMKITKRSFIAVANFVFDVDMPVAFGLKQYIPEHSDIWDRLTNLESITAQPTLFAENLECLKRDFLTTRAELNKKNLESVILAGIIIYLCSRYKEQLHIAENLTQSVCIPVLESMGLPASESSVSRYKTGFDAFIEAFCGKPVPEPVFSSEWSDWWNTFRTEVKYLCEKEPASFTHCSHAILQLPGAKKMLTGFLPSVSTADEDPPPSATREDKVQQKVKHFRKLPAAAKEKVMFRTLEKVSLEVSFLAQVEDDEGISEDLRPALSAIRKLQRELQSPSAMH